VIRSEAFAAIETMRDDISSTYMGSVNWGVRGSRRAPKRALAQDHTRTGLRGAPSGHPN
jgi:hypothetical protein